MRVNFILIEVKVEPTGYSNAHGVRPFGEKIIWDSVHVRRIVVKGLKIWNQILKGEGPWNLSSMAVIWVLWKERNYH